MNWTVMDSHAPGRLARPALSRSIIALTIIECVLLGLYAFASGAYSLLFGFVSDSCGGYHCDFGMITVGIFVTMIGCGVVGAVTIIVTIVRTVQRRRLAWVLPFVGAVLVAALFWGGYAIVITGAHLPFFGGRPA